MQTQRIAKVLDIPILAATAATVGFGLVIIRSASMVYSSSIMFVTKQALALVIGTAGLIGLAVADYRAVAGVSRWIYVGNVFLLLLVLVLGREAKGAQRWIPLGPFNLQPSEIAKLALIITLSKYLVGLGDQIRSFSGLAKSLLHIAPPALLIFKQPDMGTSLVLIALWFGLTYMAGAKIKHLLLCFLGGLLLFGVLWYTGEIKPYQKARLISCFNPDADPRGSGYHIRQSRIAVGSGQLLGKGLFKGTQKQLRFVPENHTDFIFTVVAEELGFIGGVALLSLYLIFILCAIRIAIVCEDLLGQLMAGGVAVVLTFQVVVNVGMTMGIMPVTGIPLPFFSYGPSSLVANLCAVGLLQSIYRRRFKLMF